MVFRTAHPVNCRTKSFHRAFLCAGLAPLVSLFLLLTLTLSAQASQVLYTEPFEGDGDVNLAGWQGVYDAGGSAGGLVSGPAVLAGPGQFEAEAGIASFLLRTTTDAGQITITATAAGLTGDTAHITSE